MELIQSFEYERIKVEIFYNGRNTLPNKVYIDGQLVHEDETFRPSPMYNIDDPETMTALLGFYTLRPGDTNDEFFEEIADRLVEWAQSDDDVQLMLYDYENRDNSVFLAENELSREYCTRIEQYITVH